MKTDELIKIAEKRLLKVTERPDIVMERGDGMYLFDCEGNRYLDFVGGWAVNCLGHAPKVLSEALAVQARTLVNASPSFYNRPMLEYADLLLSQSCFDRVFFTSTGAEANEGAIKLARKYGQLEKSGAAEIITTWQGFHGRTLATMAATGKKHWERLFGPKSQGFAKANFNDIESIRQAVGPSTCAVMIEPIQGEGGVNVATAAFIEELRRLCDQEAILLIFDEVQTGMARTGKLFCYEHYGIEPDIMTLGKGIGGGFPLSAVLCKEALNIFEPGDQGGTYTGQPLAMTAGLTVLRELIDRNLAGHCLNMGRLLVDRLQSLPDGLICNIRGKGLLLAFDLVSGQAPELVAACLKDGLIINAPGPSSIRLMPPLIVTREDIDRAMTILIENLRTNSDY